MINSPDWVAETCKLVMTSATASEPDKQACREAIKMVQQNADAALDWPSAAVIIVFIIALGCVGWLIARNF